MKKSLLIFIAVLTVGTASAQINKGSILVGGSSNLNFSSVKPDGSSSYSLFNIDLKGGYFVADNFTAGLNLGYQKIDSYSITTFGLFGRYYYQGKFFGGAGISILSPEGGNSETLIPFEAGYAAFITENIAVEPSLNFSIGENSNTFGLRVGFSLYLNR